MLQALKISETLPGPSQKDLADFPSAGSINSLRCIESDGAAICNSVLSRNKRTD